ncbi:MAG: hypothetical protein IJZ44_01265 [Lachnospiraceae bacterium]|nr:hypothetical protein [Lachnospiraceae bacterium]
MTSEKVLFFVKNPHVILWIVAAVFLFAGCTNYHSSIIVKDYEKVRGEICNIEEEEVLRKGVYVTRYSYDVVWEDDGDEYVMHLDGQMDAPEEGLTDIWVRPDNMDAALSSSVEIGSEVTGNLAIALVAGLAGFIAYGIRCAARKESYAEKQERLENTRLYSMIAAILSLIAVAICGIMSYQEYKETLYFNPLDADILVAFGIVGVVALIIFLCAGRQLEKK